MRPAVLHIPLKWPHSDSCFDSQVHAQAARFPNQAFLICISTSEKIDCLWILFPPSIFCPLLNRSKQTVFFNLLVQWTPILVKFINEVANSTCLQLLRHLLEVFSYPPNTFLFTIKLLYQYQWHLLMLKINGI